MPAHLILPYYYIQMVHWMSFYCKYRYRMSVASGTSFSDRQTAVSTTVQIAFSFIEDNLQQYDKFVRVLDRKVFLFVEPLL